MAAIMTAPAPQIFRSNSQEETAALARRVAANLRGGDYVSLEGDLGAGKTYFCREIARSFGICINITSPTFVLQKIYNLPREHNGILYLAHYDFYRIDNYHELLDLGYEDHDSETVILAEWGDKFLYDFPKVPVRIRFSIESEDSRLIELHNLNLR